MPKTFLILYPSLENSTTGIAIRIRSLHNVVKYFCREHNLHFHDKFLQFSYNQTHSNNASKYPLKMLWKKILPVYLSGIVAWLLDILISQSGAAWSIKISSSSTLPRQRDKQMILTLESIPLYCGLLCPDTHWLDSSKSWINWIFCVAH